MRVLVVHPDALFPPAHGGAKCMRTMAEACAGHGHPTTVLLRMHDQAHPEDVFAQSTAALAARGICGEAEARSGFTHAGVAYAGCGPDDLFPETVRRRVKTSSPEVVVVTDDALADGGAILDAALDEGRVPVAIFVWTLAGLPFGPAASAHDERATTLFRRIDRVVVPSRHAAEYVARWSRRDARVLRFPVFGPGPFPTLADRAGPVLFLNPCAAKGLPIAAALMRHLPSVRFRVVPGWGTTAHDVAQLRGMPNVDIVPRRDCIADLLAGTSVVLFPSLVEETFPLVPIEAMLHGVPVLASKVGAIPDAMLGIDSVLPAQTLERVHVAAGGRTHACWLSPPQDTAPWVAALQGLLRSPSRYAALSAAAADVARTYAAALRWEPICEALADVAATIPARQVAHG